MKRRLTSTEMGGHFKVSAFDAHAESIRPEQAQDRAGGPGRASRPGRDPDHPEITLSRREILRFILIEPTKRSEEIQTILKLEDIGQTRAALNTAQNRLLTAQKAAAAQVQASRDSDESRRPIINRSCWLSFTAFARKDRHCGTGLPGCGPRRLCHSRGQLRRRQCLSTMRMVRT